MNKVSVSLLVFSVVVLFGPGMVYAQDVTQMTLGELVTAANGTGPQESIPFLEEIVKRAPSITDPTGLQSVQQVRLQLGRVYAQLEQWDTAVKYARDYLANEPCTDRPGGLAVLCQALFVKEDWAGLRKSAQDIMNDPGKGVADRQRAELFLAQAHFNLGEFTEALKFADRALQWADEPDMQAALRLIRMRSLFETGQGDRVLGSLVDLTRGDARYDVQLNLFLIRMGDSLFDKGSFRSALAVYRMVTPKAELAGWQEQQLASLEGDKAAKVERLEKTGKSDEEKAEALAEINEQIDAVKSGLAALHDVPAYDIHIAYRVGQIYAEQKRYWEAVAVFDDVYRQHPEDWQGSASLFEMLLLLNDLGHAEEALALGREYLENNRSGLYPRLVAVYLMRYHHRRGEIDEMLDVFGYSKGWAPPEDDDVRARETDLRYMVCFAWLERSDYKKAAAAFDSVIAFDPDSQAAADAHYWRAMCSMMEPDYQDALDRFVYFRKEYAYSTFAPAALFRIGVCNFGLEDYEGAKNHFNQFIEMYPDSPLVPEALTMRGDLLGADGLLDEAMADYRRSIDLAGTFYKKSPESSALDQIIKPATYALSQTAKALELDASASRDADEVEASAQKYRQILTEVEHYESLFGKDADLAQAVFLKSKAQFQLGQADQAVQACLDTVSRFGDDPAEQGVSAILAELGGIIRTRLTDEQRDRALERLKQVRASAESRTLQLRIDVLLANLDGTQADLGRRLLAQEKTLDAVPPSALNLMCTSAFEQKDFSRAAELFNFFTAHYDDSPYINSAYRLRAEDFMTKNDINSARALATEALELFGTVRGLGWAQVMKGRAELAEENWAQAADAFSQVFNVPLWRGPLYAEAMFRMADAWLALGNVEKAFAFYQRTYLLYSSYDGGRWAADAYLKSAECLNRLGRDADARNTYRAMLLDKTVRELPQAETAKQVLGPEETTELMAGQTNRMEAVSTEVEL